MRTPSREIIESLRKEYPAGTIVELVRMDKIRRRRRQAQLELLQESMLSEA